MCILQTIVDVKNGKVPLESLQYPENINERAFRLSFMYTKMYFVFFSCLSSIGMKNLVVNKYNFLVGYLNNVIYFQSEMAFDNVYYQQLYADIKFGETELVHNQADVIESFIKIIKNKT